ncbi:MAG: ABC transporter ATP-binding protein [SAR202 cluster bacterium]|nr:ABC transporter ATP-binding protein [SAR202 cluster bacterium]
MDEAVRVEGLTKRFGSFTAVSDISFTVKTGEIFGILGPNGAGKTTTLEIIEGLQKPSQGQVTVLGMNVLKESARIKSRIGVQLQSSAYFDYLSLRELLVLMGSFYGRRVDADSLLNTVGLLDKAKSRVAKLSGGQKQRFTVAASLVNDPELIILDEPTIGLDPQARRHLWELIRQVHQRGVTVMLTTHYMDEAQVLCQRLAIMDHGQLVAVDTPQNLVGRLQATYTVKLVLTQALNGAQLEALQGLAASVQALEGNTYILRLDKTPRALDKALDAIVQGNISLEHLEVAPVTLEDVFLELTGTELRD